MGYCMNYDRIPVKHKINRKRTYAKALPLFLLVVAFALFGFVPQARTVLIGLIFPGFNNDSAEALEAFAMQIGDGMSLKEALHGFCVQIFSWMHG